MTSQKVSTQNLKAIAEWMRKDGVFFPYVKNRQLLDCAGEVLLATGDLVEIERPALISAEQIQKATVKSGYSVASKRAIENQKSRVEEYQKAESVKAKYQIQPRIQSNSGILKKLFKAIIGSSEDIDLTILGLSAIPADTSELRSAYLNALAKQHPDSGGKEKLLWALTASYEGLLARIGA
jgi:hypothetical protein